MYENIADYIRKNTDGLHGEFMVTVTDLSEKEDGCLLTLIRPHGKDGDTADFYIHADGKEEYTKDI